MSRPGRAAAWKGLAEEVAACERCPRLRRHCREVAERKRRAYAGETYWGRPVPGFGDPGARMLLVGLAPGAHGANRTGRIFTGDSSGDFLFAALHRLGLASQPGSRSRDDGLTLAGVFITAVARCAPPGNRPTPEEVARCRPFLIRELELLPGIEVIVALGGIAWAGIRPVLERCAAGAIARQPRFGHGARWEPRPDLPPVRGIYHPSRQNTQTGRLTAEMFDAALRDAWRDGRRPASWPLAAARGILRDRNVEGRSR